MQEEFVTLDPSLFTSIDKLKDSHRILQMLKKYFAENYSGPMKVVMPSDLFVELDGIIKGKTPEMLGKILKIWLPFYPKDHIEALVKYFATDDRYRNALNRLFVDFSPAPAQEYVRDVEKIGVESIHRGETVQQLGEIAGKIVFETLAVSHKLKALVVAFGKRTFNMCKRIGVKVREEVSKFKRMIKSHANVRRALRIAGYAFTLDSFQALIAQLGLPNLPFSGDIGAGLLLVADG